MARKQTRFSNRALFTLLLLVGLIFLFTPQNLTNKFRLAFARIFRLPLTFSRSLSLSVRTQQSLYEAVGRKDFNNLQNHLANLKEALLQEHKKVEKLSGLRNRFPWDGVKFVLADVITASINESQCELIINRGQGDGLSKGQFVLGDNSIIGTISSFDSRTASVKLFTDPTSHITVKMTDSNEPRLLRGNGNNSARIPMVKQKAKIGDTVFADKKAGLLDAPMLIGKVTLCKRNEQSPLLWDIIVEPGCDIEKLNDVAVIIMNPKN